jgi:hypothetical protein
LGSLFNPSDPSSDSFYAFAHLVPIVERAAAHSYLCCPPELLRIILAASQLSKLDVKSINELNVADTVKVSSSAIDAAALHAHAQAFDVYAWAQSMQRYSTQQDVESRVHTASAHRAAVCLYIQQAIPEVKQVCNVQKEELLDALFHHLAMVDEEDSHFKATSWPTFVAAAESDDLECRTWALQRLKMLWESCPWGFLYTAIETLGVIWRFKRDTKHSHDRKSLSWVQELRKMDLNFVVL